jgi:hypothetical protein
MAEAVVAYVNAAGDIIRVTPVTGLPVAGGLAPSGSKVSTKVVDLAAIALATTSTLAQCTAVDLSTNPRTMSITVEATYNIAATRGIVVHVRSSYNNVDYDTRDWDTWTPYFAANATIRQTKNYDVDPYGVKILIENLDPAQQVTAVKVYVAVGG